MIGRILVLLALIIITAVALINMQKDERIMSSDKFESKLELLTDQFSKLNTSDLERVKSLNAWIAGSISDVGKDVPEDLEQTLSMLTGYCGHRDELLINVARGLGLKAHRVSFFNVPMQLGHTATEVLIDGEWAFFDSSFGIYFTRKGSGKPIGLGMARKLYPEIDIYMVDSDLYRGEWQKVEISSYSRIKKPILLNPHDGLPMSVIERTYFASDVAGIKEKKIYFSKVLVDLQKNTYGQIGQNDNSIMDISGPFLKINGNLQYAPLMDRIGDYGDISTGREFLFLTDVNREVRMSIRFIDTQGYLLKDLDHLNGAIDYDLTKIEEVRRNGLISFKFKVMPPATSLKIWQVNGSTYIDDYEFKVVLDKDL